MTSDRRPRADAAAIVEFFDVPTGGAFDVPPEQAIGYFKAKGLKPTFSYADMLDEAHDHSFTVAKMMNVDMLGQIRASLDSALANGQTFKDWSDGIVPVLQSGGWWGRKEVLDPLTGQPMIAGLGSPARLETIFRTNMQSAYAAGQWQEIESQADIAPYLMYDAIDDLRTRPLHASWDRKVLPVTSPWWKTHYPPNGWNCRCGTIQLSEEELEAMGLTPSPEPGKSDTYTWSNPRTGEKIQVPEGLDPGFAHNSGKTYLTDLNKLLAEKTKALTADMEAAATSAKAQAAAAEALAAAKAAQAVQAAADEAKAIARAAKKAEEAAAQVAAQMQIDAIAAGKETAGKGAGYKIKALEVLKKGPTWAASKPSEQISAVLALADEFKLKTETGSKLSTYKKAVLEGKIPAPSLVKALQSLPEVDQAVFLAKIDAEVAAAAIKKVAQDTVAKAAKQAAEAAEQAAKQAAAAQAAAAAAEAAAAASASTAAAKKAATKAANAAKKAEAAAKAAQAEAVIAEGATGAPNPATLIKIGEQRGSNPGGTYQDTSTGAKWYIKQPNSIEAARNELLGGKLYELAGVDVPEMHLITLDGKASLASKIVDDLKKGSAAQLSAAPGAQEAFAIDAWLANWDVVGMGYDNLLLKGARAFRVDTGGALRFRAQGGLKGEAWGPVVDEMDSLRGTANAQSKSVFGPMTAKQIEDSVERVLRLPEADIRAVVAKHGPADAAERALLADTLIARQRDLAKRYPKAADRLKTPEPPAPSAAAGRVTKQEQEAVVASRANGYTFQTDGGAIEDHTVLVHTFTDQTGGIAKVPKTRAFLKLRPDAGDALLTEILKTAQGAKISDPTKGSVNIEEAKSSIVSALKSINSRAASGHAFDGPAITKADVAIREIGKAVADINKALAVATDGKKYLTEVRDGLAEWGKQIHAAKLAGIAGGKAVPVAGGMFVPGNYLNDIIYPIKATTAAAKPAAKITWQTQTDSVTFNVSKFDKSSATETAQTGSLTGSGRHYVGTMADGTKITYIPSGPRAQGAFATQGIVKIDVPGQSIEATERAFKALDEMGINTARATTTDREIYYLNSYANLRLHRETANADAWKKYKEITATGEEGVRQRAAHIKRETGIDVQQSEAWKQVDGTRQAFGHGRAYVSRPDLDTPDFRKFEGQGYEVFHNPNGLGHNSGRDVFASVRTVVDGGGQFASLVDRFRRGVDLDGSSVSSDLDGGGGDYYFTRILKNNPNTGIYWKPRVLKRQDAISYSSDNFGRTRGNNIENERRGQSVTDFRKLANGSSNETIFKGSLSAFDDLENIVLYDAAEVAEALKFMRGRGYTTWPDGRALETVIITKEQKAKKAVGGKP